MSFDRAEIKEPERIFEVRRTDMDEEIQQEAVDTAKIAMEISMDSVDIAEYIKKRFDKLFMPSWHCIVGPHFAGQARSQNIDQMSSFGERLEVRSTKMSRLMEQDALEVASRALQRSKEPREIAQYIKKEFDHKYEPNWHCIVGNHFGSYVTHIENNFIYFSQGRLAILLFKTS